MLYQHMVSDIYLDINPLSPPAYIWKVHRLLQ